MAHLAKILFINPRENHRERVEHPKVPVVDSSPRERGARWILLALLLGSLGLFWAGVSVSRRDSAAGIQDLPAEARRSLYTQTLRELEGICRTSSAANGELREHCVAQARFVLELPECTEACQRVATMTLPHAHR